MFKACVLADSTHNNNRLITLEVEMPRYIWPEVLTHREFSRCAQSSRAIPNYRLINSLRGDSKVTPIFMLNQPGMTASIPLANGALDTAEDIWDQAREDAIAHAERLTTLGVHKQIVNRLIEPFSTIKAIVSSTSFDNFFKLRISDDAQQEIQAIAKLMKSKIDLSTSRRVDLEYWHLPLVTYTERDMYSIEILKKLCVARCARVSYLNHNGISSVEDDLRLYESLRTNNHCVIEGTQILSKDGFINIEDVTLDTILASVDVDTTEFKSWERPTRLISNVCDVYLYPEYNLGVSHGHTMIGAILTKCDNRDSTEYTKYTPGESTGPLCRKATKGMQEANLPSYCKYTGEGTTFGKLVGFYIGDGFNLVKGHAEFRLVKKRKRLYLESILKELELEYTVSEKGVTSSNNIIYQYRVKIGHLHDICGVSAKFKRIPEEAYEDLNYLKGIFDGLKNSDGSIKRKTWSYCTTSEILANQIETLAPLIGLQGHLRKGSLYKFIIGFRTRKYAKINDSRRESTQVVIVKDTKVRGVTIKDGAIVIKTSTGEIFVTGNCSPMEHCATPMVGKHGNFTGWIQHRQEVSL